MATELDALRAVDFDWALHLDSVWEDSVYHVPELHQSLRDEIVKELELRVGPPASVHSPLGWVIVGAAGSGKTHLLGSLRQEIFAKGAFFILVDMTDVRDFWETVLLGYVNSLQQKMPDSRRQYQVVLSRLLGKVVRHETESDKTLQTFALANADNLVRLTSQVISNLKRQFGVGVQQYTDIIRALLLLNSDNNLLSDYGYCWLQGLELDTDIAKRHQFLRSHAKPIDIVHSLSGVMSLVGPTLLAIDQMDAIVSEHNLAGGSGDEPVTDEQRASRAIIEGLSGGLMALKDKTRRTLTVVACLEATWEILSSRSIGSSPDRFTTPPRSLKYIMRSEIAQEIVIRRLNAAYHRNEFHPPYQSWPFRPEFFADDAIANNTPRHILKLCDQHRRRCLQESKITELSLFSEITSIGPTHGQKSVLEDLDRHFRQLKQETVTANLIDEANEDDALCQLLQVACRCVIKENPPSSENVDVVVEENFPGGKTYRALHARIRFIDRSQNDRETHFSFRALERRNAVAYQNRLKAAITASGIDRDLPFRHLVIVRRAPVPTGAVSQKLTDQFRQAGGHMASPSDDDLWTLWALQELEKGKPEHFEEWLRSRRPVSQTQLFQSAQISLCEQGVSQPSIVKPVDQLPKSTGQRSVVTQLPVGRRLISDQLKELISLDPRALTKHTAILAGAGSGKTVLVRRLVEEAALLNIPSIIVDAANDLARLGDAWPTPPEQWDESEIVKAKQFHDRTEVVIWTPGREKGNPLKLNPIPNFVSLGDDRDELQQAIDMTREALQGLVAPGDSTKAQKKRGVLAEALRYFSQQKDGGLDDFVALLSDLPIEAGGGITDAPKIAKEMADQLRAAIATNPLLASQGAALDPARLLKAKNKDKTRISVINFIGLQGLSAQQEFLNQLAMTLFTWIKKNPARPAQPLQGLLVIDEAKDFIPAIQTVACRSSILRLSAQARKYGLGLIFATQAPKSIDHNVIANCSTQFYGQANSPAAIEVIKEQIRQRGGSGDDVARLGTGRFYLYTEGMQAPVKIKTEMCLSHHPPTPLDEAGVLQRAEMSRSLI